jgi:hypothetical protein
MVTLQEDKFEELVIKLSKELDYNYDAGNCVIFGINIKDDSYEAEEITTHGDIYEMLDSDDIDLLVEASKYDYLTVGTCGWAAPIDNNNDEDNDLPPSQHPAKRRVKLLCTSNTNQIGNTISFQDQKEHLNPVVDLGNAKGSLAIAFNAFVESSFKFKV